MVSGRQRRHGPEGIRRMLRSRRVLGGGNLPLDAIPETNLRAAYSFRRLRTAYTGACCRIRRSSDNAEIDIDFVDDFVDTAAIESHCSGTDGYVRIMYDQSGGGLDLDQTDTTRQPIIYDDSEYGLESRDGHLAMYFSTTSDYFSQAGGDDGWGLAGTNPSADVFWVGASLKVGSTYGWSVGDAGSGTRFAQNLEGHNTLSMRFGNGYQQFTPNTSPLSRLSSHHARRPLNAQHQDSEWWQSDISLSAGTAGNPTNTITVSAGIGSECLGADGGPSSPIEGQRIAEFILYGSTTDTNALLSADTATIRANQAAYYDESWTEYMTDTGYEALWDTAVISEMSETVTSGASSVDTWNDKTGNHDAIQTTAGDRPRFQTDPPLLNGHVGLEFGIGGASYQMEVSSFELASTDTYAIFAVFDTDALAVAGLWGVEDSGSTEQILCRVNATTGTLTHFRNALAATHTSTAAVSINTPTRIMFAYDGTNSILRVEGSAEESVAIAAGSHSGGGSVMGARADASRTQNWRGHTYSIVIYKNGTLPASASERAQAWADLGARFGL